MKAYELIIFDCDGTLLDSELAYNYSAIDAFAAYGLPKYPLDYTLQNWMGRSMNDIVKFEAEKHKVDLSAKDVIATYLGKVPDYQSQYIREIEGALDAVTMLSKNFKCCVASNGEIENISRSLKLMGYADLFRAEHVFSKDHVKRAKPHPDLFLYACEKMGAEPGNTIVIEDSLTGVKAGRAADMYVIGFNGVGHGDLQSPEKLKDVGADVVFSDWKDIVTHINKVAS